MRHLVVLILLLPAPLQAAEFRLLDVDQFSVEGSRFAENRDPMTPNTDQKEYVGRAAARFDLRLLEVGYWRNWVHSEGVDSRFTTVGWQWELGVHVSKYIDLFHYHHSRHVMDGEQPLVFNERSTEPERNRFPVEDSYGMRLIFYLNPRPHSSLFN